MADTLSDLLRTLIGGALQTLGTKVPGAPLAPGTAGPPNPETTSYAPAIETGLGALAGALTPQYGPNGRRTWGGQIGNAIIGGMGGYNAAENQLTAQQRAA